jgi:hypothetical protein
MSGSLNDNHKAESVRNFADQQQHSCSGRPRGLETRIARAFENWLMEYQDRVANVLQDETTNIQNGRESTAP